MKTLFVLSLPLCITSFAYSANSVWILDESLSQWGSYANGGISNGSYTGPYQRHADLSSGAGNIGAFDPVGRSFGEGPEDGQSVIFGYQNNTGTITAVDSVTTYDLSSAGDSITFKFVNFLVDPIRQLNATTGYTSDYTLFELGLTSTNSTVSHLGDTGTDSFFFAGVENTTVGGPFIQDGLGQFDLRAYDEDTIGGTVSGDTLGAGTNITTGLTLDAIARTGPQDSTTPSNPGGVAYFYDITITTLADGSTLGSSQFQVDYALTELNITGMQATDTIITGATTSGSTNVTHGLTDLSSLAIAMGARTLGDDAPISGSTFDWNATAASLVPEPSSFTFLALGAFALAFRRKRS